MGDEPVRWVKAGSAACHRLRPVALLSAALLLAGAAAPAPSNTLQSVDTQRQARSIDRDADQARAKAAAASISELRGKLIRLGRQESDGQRSVGGASAALARLNLQEAELKVRMGRNQQSLTQLLGALQMYARNPPPPLLVDPRSARNAVRAAILIKAITPELEVRAKAFSSQSDALKRVRRQADVQSGMLFQAESSVAEQEAQITDLIAQKKALEKQLYADASAAQDDVHRLAARAKSLGELVHALDARSATQGDADALPVRFTAPVPGSLAHSFGQAGGDPERAKGVSWTTSPKASVLSPAAASVDYAGPLKGWGNVLILRSGEYHLVLAGLGQIGTETGRTVAGGEPIGEMPGDTPHPSLYLEVRRATRPVDPGRWLVEAAPRRG